MIKFIMLVCIFAAIAFAGNGVAGDRIIGLLMKWCSTDPGTAVSVYTSLVTIVLAIVRVLLKKTHTKTCGFCGVIFWNLATLLFGDGVKLQNHEDPEYVREQLQKKYPLLNIEVKK